MSTLIGYSSAGTGVRYDLGTTDSIFVVPGATIVSTDSNAISGVGSGHSVTVAGAVFGSYIAIDLGDDAATDSGQFVHVLAGAAVAGIQTYDSAGVRLFGSSTLVNDGEISANIGVVLWNDASGSSSMVNRGTITGSNYGVAIYSGAAATLTNFGSIYGGDYAVHPTGGAAQVSIHNRGEILGTVDTGYGNDTINNRNGTIEGDITMGEGNDVYNGIRGTVSGTVLGQGGSDKFIGNALLAEVFDGGDGVDTLDFSLMGAVVVALDNSLLAGGSALDDTYISFENVFGSNSGDDVIVGSNAANTLFGNGGNDVINGLRGNDVLRGGVGADILSGGHGHDTFRYYRTNEFGDKITDFSSAAVGNNDRFQFSTAIGGGIEVGVIDASEFQVRGDNQAQDADDRFIFRTTDHTLWFDEDGNGAAAALMVADLQAGATVTAGDIFIF